MTDTTPADGPKPKEFAALLLEHLGGRSHDALSDGFHELLAAVAEHGKKGSMTITVAVEPSKGMDGAPVAIAIDHTVKAPRATPAAALFFIDREGNATRNDPRQTAAFAVEDIRTAPTTDTSNARSAH